MTIPVGPRVPRRGNALSRGLARSVLWLMGWRHAGAIADEPKLVMIGAPHTTNFDGVIAIASLMALGLDARTLIKKSAFHGVLGSFLGWAGAVPIDRSVRDGVIGQSIAMMAKRTSLLLLLAPEGTRDGATEWKRGFHHIALGAKVPILAVACNYKTKLITFGPTLMPGDDYAADLVHTLRFVHQHGHPRHVDRLSKPLRDLRKAEPPP